MKPRYSFVVPLRDDELDDAINRLYCGCLLSLAERERVAAWMETKRVYTVPEALHNEIIEKCADIAECAEPNDDRDHSECPFCSIARGIRMMKTISSPQLRSQEERS